MREDAGLLVEPHYDTLIINGDAGFPGVRVPVGWGEDKTAFIVQYGEYYLTFFTPTTGWVPRNEDTFVGSGQLPGTIDVRRLFTDSFLLEGERAHTSFALEGIFIRDIEDVEVTLSSEREGLFSTTFDADDGLAIGDGNI